MGQINGEQLGKEKILHLMVQMALPSIAAQTINILYSIIDRIYIGHIEGIGTDALTCVGLTLPIITLISAFWRLSGREERRLQRFFSGRG